MRAVHLRLVLALDLAAAGAAGAALVLAVGLPLAARGTLGPRALAALAVGGALLGVAVGAALLVRQVARPVDRILAAAESLGAVAGELPLLGAPDEGGGRGLSGAAVAFERLAAALAAERARLAEKVAELERANEALLAARESLVRAERLATAGRLASGVAHEVGNPLGAITGYVELARDRLRATARAQGTPGDAPPAPGADRTSAAGAELVRAGGSEGRAPREAAGVSSREEADDFLARIGAEAHRIDRLVRDLLDLARPAEPALAPVDLAGAIDAALRLARVQPRFRAVAVDVDLPPGLAPVRADARRLAQVLLNLLLNAGDAMRGEGRVRVAARAAGGEVVVEVEDSGPGIAAADLPRVFEPFFTTKAAGEGTGLGLAISLGIVESFGGALAAANAPGGGARFTLRLRAA